MSASALNAAPPPSTGPAAATGAAASQAAGQAKGPLAGFEALLATFFGAQPQPGAVAPGVNTKSGKDAESVLTEGEGVPAAAGDVAPAKTPEDIKAAEAAAAALAAYNTGLGMPVAVAPIANGPAPAVDTTASGGEAAAVVSDGKGSAKAVVPGFPQEEPQVATTEGGARSAETRIAAGRPLPDPNAGAAGNLARLEASVAARPEAAQPTRVAAQPAAAPAPAAEPQSPSPLPADTAALAAAAQGQTTSQAGVRLAEETAPAAAAPVATKDKAQGAKPVRGEHTRADADPPAMMKPGASAVAPVADGAPKGGAEDHAAQTSTMEAKTEAADTPAGSADAGGATASTTNASTLIHAGTIPVRGSPQTVANLAAQIAKKLEGRSTRFDLELNPQGLGRVDVRMEIGATGRMSAAMTFDTPAAAAELRARASELQRHLEQAGFDLSGGLSFDVAGDRGQGRQAQQQQADSNAGQAFRGRAFQQALATADGAAQSAVSGALNLRRGLISGVDVRI